MAKQTAIKLHVEVGADHTVKLPAEVPVGPAELIVLVDEGANAATSLLGPFANEPEVVDEAMGYVRAHRQKWRIRPVT
jgi:hypothetical protein